MADMVDEVKKFLGISPLIGRFLRKAVIFVAIFEIIKITPPYIFKNVIDSMVAYDPEVGISLSLVVWLVGGYLLSMSLMTLMEMINIRTLYMKIHNIEIDLLKKTLRKLLSLDLAYHQRENTGSKVSRILNGTSRVVDMMFRSLDMMLPSVIQSVVTLIIVAFTSPLIALIYVLFTPAFIFVLYRDARVTQKARERVQEEHETVWGLISQSVYNVRTVKDHDCEEYELARTSRPLSRFGRAVDTRNYLGVWCTGFEDILLSLGRVVTLAVGIFLMTRGEITPGGLVFVVTLTEKAYLNLQRLSKGYYFMQDAAPAIERLHKVFSQPVLVKEDPGSKSKIRTGQVDFHDVSFSYDGKKNALDDVSFTIESKSVTALVGRSGSGKTTAVNLILRHFDPTRGSIKIDGVDLRDYSFKELRSNVTIVSQDVEVFNDTVLENIAYGIKGAARKDVVAAARLAHADGFIRRLDKGYDTLIGERGVRLSGGQKQRLAIARALLRKPKVLIFDEATSSLDAESERYIHSAIMGLAGKLTLIIIAHRFATIQKADKIILLEDGRLKEIGSHKELIRKKGIFYKLRKLQELGDVE